MTVDRDSVFVRPTVDLTEHLRREIAGLRRAIESRATIEQAKGILMVRFQVDDDAAFAILRRWSMSSQFKVRDLALALIDLSLGATPVSSTPDSALHVVDRGLRVSDPQARLAAGW